MKVGTKSVLFGAHCWFIHPWFVAWAWWQLYGFPWDPRLWVAFFVHDLGYWGKPNMDGPEGENHVHFGAALMHRLFDKRCTNALCSDGRICSGDSESGTHFYWCDCRRWWCFMLFHSRFYAAQWGQRMISRLGIADKLAVALEPWWLYLPRAIASGEIKEYMEKAQRGKYASMALATEAGYRAWLRSVQNYLRAWVEEHRDSRVDRWTRLTTEENQVEQSVPTEEVAVVSERPLQVLGEMVAHSLVFECSADGNPLKEHFTGAEVLDEGIITDEQDDHEIYSVIVTDPVGKRYQVDVYELD